MSKEELTIYITPRTWGKLFAYAEECETEISGFASYNREGVIDTLYPLLEQSCSGSDTELDEDDLAKFVLSGQSKRSNIWWHSHVNMGAFWSTTDEANIETLGEFYPTLVSIVINKKREYKARIDYFVPIRLKYEHVALQILYNLPEVDREKVKAEVKEKVGKPKKIEIVDEKDDKIITTGRVITPPYGYGYRSGIATPGGGVPPWLAERGMCIVNGKVMSEKEAKEYISRTNRSKYPGLFDDEKGGEG